MDPCLGPNMESQGQVARPGGAEICLKLVFDTDLYECCIDLAQHRVDILLI